MAWSLCGYFKLENVMINKFKQIDKFIKFIVVNKLCPNIFSNYY